MKTKIIKQAEKSHNANQLHDQLIAAGLNPLAVESTAAESKFTFEEAASDSSIDAVIAAHAPQQLAAPPNLKALWATYRTNLQAATTVAQIKTVLTNDLGPILRAMAVGHRGDMNGG